MALNTNSPLKSSVSTGIQTHLQTAQQGQTSSKAFSALRRIAPCAMMLCSPKIVAATPMCLPPLPLKPIDIQLFDFGKTIRTNLFSDAPFSNSPGSLGQQMMGNLTTGLAQSPIFSCTEDHKHTSDTKPNLPFSLTEDGLGLTLNEHPEPTDTVCISTMIQSGHQTLKSREEDITKLQRSAAASVKGLPSTDQTSELYEEFVVSVINALNDPDKPSPASTEELLHFVIDAGLNYFSRAQKSNDLRRLTYATPLISAAAAVLVLWGNRARRLAEDENLRRPVIALDPDVRRLLLAQLLQELQQELQREALTPVWRHRPTEWPYGDTTLIEFKQHIETVTPLLNALADYIEEKIEQEPQSDLEQFYDAINCKPFCYPMRLPLLNSANNPIPAGKDSSFEEFYDLPTLLMKDNKRESPFEITTPTLNESEFRTYANGKRPYADLEPVPSRSLPALIEHLPGNNDFSTALEEIYPEVSEAQIDSLCFLCGIGEDVR